MRAEEFRDFVKQQPFQPFRITLTDGRTYDVVHPDLAMVGHHVVVVGLPRANGPNFIFDRQVTISFLHIMQIEPLTSATPPTNVTQGNGE